MTVFITELWWRKCHIQIVDAVIMLQMQICNDFRLKWSFRSTWPSHCVLRYNHQSLNSFEINSSWSSSNLIFLSLCLTPQTLTWAPLTKSPLSVVKINLNNPNHFPIHLLSHSLVDPVLPFALILPSPTGPSKNSCCYPAEPAAPTNTSTNSHRRWGLDGNVHMLYICALLCSWSFPYLFFNLFLKVWN